MVMVVVKGMEEGSRQVMVVVKGIRGGILNFSHLRRSSCCRCN